MYGFIIVIMIIIALLLILAVLVQRSKGGGFSSSVNANQFMGVQKSTDFIEKTTWTLAVSLFLLCLVVGIWGKSSNRNVEQKSKLDDVNKEAPVTLPENTPPGGNQQGNPPAQEGTPAQ